MNSFANTVAMVTGAGSGIGRALSVELARRGAFVHVSDVNGATAAETAALINNSGGSSAKADTLDVRDAVAVQRYCDAIGDLDYQFNNAGIGVGGELFELTVAHWDRIIDINLRGVIHGVQAAYPKMVLRGRGHIINTASVAGLMPTPLLTPYATTKHAVVGLSTSLRAEAAIYGVRVSALCPATIETPILDSRGPSDLPRPRWMPDGREFLTKGGGPPYPAHKLAEDTLDAVERNVGIIAIPGRAKLMWRGYRLSPRLVELASVRLLAMVRKTKPQS